MKQMSWVLSMFVVLCACASKDEVVFVILYDFACERRETEEEAYWISVAKMFEFSLITGVWDRIG